MSNLVATCHSCGAQIQMLPGQKISRLETCGQCDADLHCCRNCRLMDPGKHNQCSEPQAEWVSDKDRANYCDYFEPRTSIDLVQRSGAGADSTRDAFDALFKKK